MKFKLAKLLAVWFGAGLSPKAPGTVGTLAALPFAWGIHLAGGSMALLIASMLAFAIGCWASSVYVRETGREDPSEVVIDEVAAMWLVLTFIPVDVVLWCIAFWLFRVFDILKPWPVILADRKVKGGFGVMLDDLLAAGYTLIVFGIFYYVFAAAGLTAFTLAIMGG